jgi:hypothetical protein
MLYRYKQYRQREFGADPVSEFLGRRCTGADSRWRRYINRRQPLAGSV